MAWFVTLGGEEGDDDAAAAGERRKNHRPIIHDPQGSLVGPPFKGGVGIPGVPNRGPYAG